MCNENKNYIIWLILFLLFRFIGWFALNCYFFSQNSNEFFIGCGSAGKLINVMHTNGKNELIESLLGDLVRD